MSGPMRIAAAILVCVITAGCAGTGVTSDRLERSVGSAFTRQYRWQLQLEGRPVPGRLDTRAECARGGSGDRGAGSDWMCTIQYFEAGPSTPVTFSYDVNVHPDGCWTAESGPALLGGRNLSTKSRKTIPNPLYAIDACFRTI